MQAIGIIGAIGQHIIGIEAFDQRLGLSDVAMLPRCGDQAHGIAQRFDGGMYLGGQAASRTTQALGIRPPFSRRAPAAWL